METGIIIAVGVGLAVLYIIFMQHGGNQSAKKINYKTAYLTKEEAGLKWMEIEQQLELGKPSNLSKAILDADKLLDEALKSLRIKGDTMGDRLKNAKSMFEQNSYSEVWEAHKLRNYFAHEINAIINASQVKEALDGFKKGLKNLGKL